MARSDVPSCPSCRCVEHEGLFPHEIDRVSHGVLSSKMPSCTALRIPALLSVIGREMGVPRFTLLRVVSWALDHEAPAESIPRCRHRLLG